MSPYHHVNLRFQFRGKDRRRLSKDKTEDMNETPINLTSRDSPTGVKRSFYYCSGMSNISWNNVGKPLDVVRAYLDP